MQVNNESELAAAIQTATTTQKDSFCFIETICHKDDTSKELLEWGSRVSAANSRPPTNYTWILFFKWSPKSLNSWKKIQMELHNLLLVLTEHCCKMCTIHAAGYGELQFPTNLLDFVDRFNCWECFWNLWHSLTLKTGVSISLHIHPSAQLLRCSYYSPCTTKLNMPNL